MQFILRAIRAAEEAMLEAAQPSVDGAAPPVPAPAQGSPLTVPRAAAAIMTELQKLSATSSAAAAAALLSQGGAGKGEAAPAIQVRG